MSEAADGNPEVRALVYIASFLLDEGESTGELAGRFPGNEFGPALRPVPVSSPDGQTVNDLYIQQERFREVFAADVSPDVADLMAVIQRQPDRTDAGGSPRRKRRPASASSARGRPCGKPSGRSSGWHAPILLICRPARASDHHACRSEKCDPLDSSDG